MQFILITGSSSGIGRYTALEFSRKGYYVFAGVRKKRDAVFFKNKNITTLFPVFLDITKESSIRKAYQIISNKVKSSDLFGLINNAGINISGPIEILPMKEFKKQFDVNLFGHLNVIQVFLPLLRRTKGRIINVGSISSIITAPFIGPYSASKAAMKVMSDALRLELIPWGIKVSYIIPGSVLTGMWKKTMSKSQQIINNLKSDNLKLYKTAMNNVQKTRARLGQSGISMNLVADAIDKALNKKDPLCYYYIGKQAKIFSFIAKYLSPKKRDKLILFHLNVSK